MTIKESVTNSTLQVSGSPHLRKCIYTGRLKNDLNSSVSLNVCNG
ncbi:hypothetical protein X975_26111, partial [Stegodyphus mimosarum]